MNLINEKYNLWLSKEISDREMALYFFVSSHAQKYSNKKMLDLLCESSLPENILQIFRFKKVKGKAVEALKMWIDNQWPLVLVDKVLSPYEVLNYQSQGLRPVSMIIQNEFQPILHKEDCLEFFVHDLEHAYMFFHDETLKQMQISFFSNVKTSIAEGMWQSYLNDQTFKERFYYLISDMNTHAEHYRHYLKAMLPPQEFTKFDFLFK